MNNMDYSNENKQNNLNIFAKSGFDIKDAIKGLKKLQLLIDKAKLRLK